MTGRTLSRLRSPSSTKFSILLRLITVQYYCVCTHTRYLYRVVPRCTHRLTNRWCVHTQGALPGVYTHVYTAFAMLLAKGTRAQITNCCQAASSQPCDHAGRERAGAQDHGACRDAAAPAPRRRYRRAAAGQRQRPRRPAQPARAGGHGRRDRRENLPVSHRAANSRGPRGPTGPLRTPSRTLGPSPYRESSIGNAPALVPGPLARL